MAESVIHPERKYFDYVVPSQTYNKQTFTEIAIPQQSGESYTSRRLYAKIVDGYAGYIGYFLAFVTYTTTCWVYNANSQYNFTDTITIRVYFE